MSIKEALSKLKQADLMAMFDVTDRTIQRWHDQGLPRHGEGRGCFYVWTEVRPWYLAFMSGSLGGDKSGKSLSDKDRKLKGEADIEEMKAAEMAGDLVRVKEVQKVWNDFLSRLNSSLDGYPDRTADQLADGMILAERVAVLRKEMNILRRDIVAEIQRGTEVEAAS
jgi:phage terminase Nu1 subunit (DNA packaging protein)